MSEGSIRWKDIVPEDMTAEKLSELIKRKIVEDVGVEDDVFEQHIFETERALGIKVYEVSGSLWEQWGCKSRHISNIELEEDIFNWQKHFEPGMKE